MLETVAARIHRIVSKVQIRESGGEWEVHFETMPDGEWSFITTTATENERKIDCKKPKQYKDIERCLSRVKAMFPGIRVIELSLE